MNFAIVDRTSLKIKNVYWTEDGVCDTGRPDVDETCVQVAVPLGMDYWSIKCLPDFSICLDDDKVAAKNAEILTKIRNERNTRLLACDWTQLADTRISLDKKEAWSAYRQELRDFPELITETMLASYPTSIIWPLDPTQVSPVPPSGSSAQSLNGMTSPPM
jgi:hypothetical protein